MTKLPPPIALAFSLTLLFASLTHAQQAAPLLAEKALPADESSLPGDGPLRRYEAYVNSVTAYVAVGPTNAKSSPPIAGPSTEANCQMELRQVAALAYSDAGTIIVPSA